MSITHDPHGVGSRRIRLARHPAASAGRRDAAADRAETTGDVNVAITEGLGTFWLAPRLEMFQQAYPEVQVHLDCAMTLPDVRHIKSGVAVQLTDVSDPGVRRLKLGRIHAMPFAAQCYVEAFGIPQALNDVPRHRLVLQMADQTATRELFAMVMTGVSESDVVAVRSSSSTSHYRMIAEGQGIGFLPTYLVAVCEPLVPIDMNLHFPFDVWLVCDSDAAKIPRVQRFMDWLVQSFDPQKFPWFRDHFIHPTELLNEYRGPPIAKFAL